jgi:hypothetical protein
MATASSSGQLVALACTRNMMREDEHHIPYTVPNARTFRALQCGVRFRDACSEALPNEKKNDGVSCASKSYTKDASKSRASESCLDGVSCDRCRVHVSACPHETGTFPSHRKVHDVTTLAARTVFFSAERTRSVMVLRVLSLAPAFIPRRARRIDSGAEYAHLDCKETQS